MNNRKSFKKPNAKQRDVESKPSVLGFWSRGKILLAILVVLVAIFIGNGGFVGFFDSMATNALARNQLAPAERWLNWASHFSSTNARAEFLRARLARKQGQLDRMAEFLQVAYKLGYDKTQLQHEQDLGLASMGRLEGGTEERLIQWLAESPAEADEIIDAYANGLTALSRFDDAVRLLVEWEQASPSNPIANYRRARIHEYFHLPEEAEKEYQKAIGKDPTFSKASYHLARVLLQRRHPEEALEYFRACEKGAPALAAKTGIAGCYRSLGEPEKARKTLLEVMESSYDAIQNSYRSVDESQERFVAASELGCIETELGEFAEARKHLELALDKFPLDSIARYSYAVTLRGLGLTDEAEENFERTRKARAALDQVSELQEVLRKQPNDTEARMRIGKIILEHEAEHAGVFWIQSIFAYDPDNAEAHQTLAEYYEAKPNPSTDDKKLAQYHRSFLNKQKADGKD